MRFIITVIMALFLQVASASQAISVFVSFSMPNQLLEETLHEASRLHIPTYLNGLYHDSMSETVIKIMALSEHIPDLNLQIDPTLFEQFAIHQVPALVVSDGKDFDVIYGNLSLKEGLSRMGGVTFGSQHNG